MKYVIIYIQFINKNQNIVTVKITETKIYLKFIFWFLAVSLLPIVVLFALIYLFVPDTAILKEPELYKPILIGIFVSIAFVFLLSLLATRRLSKLITKPIQVSVEELSKVVEALLKSVQDLSEIGQNNSEISQFLLTSSQEQQKGLKTGTKAVAEMVQSLNKITRKTKASAKDATKIDELAGQSTKKSELALDSLVAVKQLATENQKLSQALDTYANHVKDIARRVEILADTAKFLSLNVSIEAGKTSFSEDFSSLVSQIRELNITSEQAANSIQSLAGNMQRQIKQAKESSVFEWEETNKSINIIAQTVKFLNKIIGNVSNISKSVQIINKETEETSSEADNINIMINDLNKESKSLVKRTDNIANIINKQLVVTRALNRSSEALNNVTDTLNNLVGKT